MAVTITDLADFNGANGQNPISGLTLSGITLYETAENGGANSDGVVYALNLAPEPGIWTLAALGAGACWLAWVRGRRHRAA